MLFLISKVANVVALGESYDQLVALGTTDADPENTNLRGLSWFGFGEDKDAKKDTNQPEHGNESTKTIELIESVPCEPLHERALQFVNLFGDVNSGNEACAAEADPDSCSRGCCRFGTTFLCDETNAFIDLPCVCGRNTAANHPHKGHLHTTGVERQPYLDEDEVTEKGTLKQKIPANVERDGEGTTHTEKGSSPPKSQQGKSEGFFTSVVDFLEGKSQSKDDKDDSVTSSKSEDRPSSTDDEATKRKGDHSPKASSVDVGDDMTGNTIDREHDSNGASLETKPARISHDGKESEDNKEIDKGSSSSDEKKGETHSESDFAPDSADEYETKHMSAD